MLVLGIETTCDETSCALVQDGEEILTHTIVSQADMHAEYGGVFPEMASREHVLQMLPCLHKTLGTHALNDIDLIAVANEPGLMGSLLMGVTTAQMLCYALDKPIVGVNHVKAHLYAAMMGNERHFPALGILLSGGHTFLVDIQNETTYTVISTTVDDAIGEAFDKVASMLGLPYPGGPHIEQLAKQGKKERFSFSAGRVKTNPLAFSFSGIKTNVLYTVSETQPDEQAKADIAAAFQDAVFSDVLTKAGKALKTEHRAIYVGGGVTMNQTLRTLAKKRYDLPIFFPKKELSLDNAAMIAGMGFHLRSQASTPERLECSPRFAH